ncbi:hypothetical protein AB205_0149490 [Aquarana catesbeiana]|uniref:Uncharacterized protein n=1 Tax=Aquarana catesbeiana TaxID=8400 RepID=A0A2G9QCC2_AQUCT|nr:hypothetical protein AB205_0149490 [Aquarana catesbeiana]
MGFPHRGTPNQNVKKNGVGVPLNSIPGPSGLVWILRGTPAKILKKMAWGSPSKSIPDPYPSTQPGRPQEKRGGRESAPPPEPYQAICPQHWEGALGSPQSTLSPCRWGQGPRPHNPCLVVVGVCGRGAYWNLEAPLTRGPPDLAPPCEMVRGYFPYHFTKKSVKSVKNDKRQFLTIPLFKNEEGKKTPRRKMPDENAGARSRGLEEEPEEEEDGGRNRRKIEERR